MTGSRSSGTLNVPPRPSQADQALPSQDWWYIELSVPSANTSSARTPGSHRRGTVEGTASGLPGRGRRPPAAAVPGLVVHRVVSPQREHIEPVRTPGGHRRGTVEGTAEPRPGRPGAAVPGLVVHRVVGPQREHIEPARTPGSDRRGTVEGTASGLQVVGVGPQPLPSQDLWYIELSVPSANTSSPARTQEATAGALWKVPPSPAQADQALPSQDWWYIELSVPSANTSSRSGPQEATAGGLLKVPPRASQVVGVGPQPLPSQDLWYIELSVPSANTSSGPDPGGHRRGAVEGTAEPRPGRPGAAVPGLVVHRVVGPQREHIEPVWTPGSHRNISGTHLTPTFLTV